MNRSAITSTSGILPFGLLCLPLFLTMLTGGWAVQAAAESSPPIKARMQCSAYSKNPSKFPSYATDLQFTLSDGKLLAMRQTTLQPGKEAFEGSVDASNIIKVSGHGSYENGAHWVTHFSGAFPAKGRVIIHGMLEGEDKGTRLCSILFLDSSTSLKAKLSPILALKTEQQQLASTQAHTDRQVNAMIRILGDIVLPVTERPDDWMIRVAAIPVQQQQFCRIVDRFYDELDEAYRARNEIRQNNLFRDQRADMVALLPHGSFENWVVRVLLVTQAGDGNAAVMLQPPCRAVLTSNACPDDSSPISTLISADSPLYRELEHVRAGDFVVISGKLPYAESDVPGHRTPTATVHRAGSGCLSPQGENKEDIFVTQIRYLARLQ